MKTTSNASLTTDFAVIGLVVAACLVLLMGGCSALPIIPDNPRYRNVTYVPPAAPHVDNTQTPPPAWVQERDAWRAKPAVEVTETEIIHNDPNGRWIEKRKAPVDESIDQACNLVEDIEADKQNVRYQWSEAKKYGVIDKHELLRSKERIESSESRLEGVSNQIKRLRGKPFNPKKDCNA